MEIEIREAAISDCTAIYDLNKNSLGYDYPLEKTQVQLQKILTGGTEKIFVACIDGGIAGYIHAADYECLFENSRKNIIGIAVDRRYQNQGIGTALVAAVEEWAKNTGAAGVRLVSGSNRHEAHRFYTAKGYRMRKEQKNFVKYFEEIGE